MTKKLTWVAAILAIMAIVAASAYYFLQRDTTKLSGNGNLTIHDSQGRDVVVHIPTKRIITLTNADTEVLVALGEKPLATVSNFNMSEQTKQYLEGVPRVGVVTSPSLEEIIRLHPDIVLAGPVPFQTSLAPSLEKAGIPIAFLKVNTYQEILDRIQLLGALSGKTDVAQNLVTNIQNRVHKIREAYQDKPKKKIAIIWGTVSSFHLASSYTFVGDLVGQVPVQNIADQFSEQMTKKGLGAGYVALDMEYIAKADPDIVLVVAHGVSQANATQFLAAFENQAAWQSLRAVREGRVYHLPSDLFAANPNVRTADSVAYIGRLLYGESK